MTARQQDRKPEIGEREGKSDTGGRCEGGSVEQSRKVRARRRKGGKAAARADDSFLPSHSGLAEQSRG